MQLKNVDIILCTQVYVLNTDMIFHLIVDNLSTVLLFLSLWFFTHR